MDAKVANIASMILATLGVILILAMAFGVSDVGGNTLIFAGVVCFILAGAIRRIAGLEDDPDGGVPLEAAQNTSEPESGDGVSDPAAVADGVSPSPESLKDD